MADPGPTFITVKFGDNQARIFNPWCPVYQLLHYIKQKCKCEDRVTVDLIDLEGHVKHLPARLHDYATAVVTGRETYILVKVEQPDPLSPVKYTALLQDFEQLHPDLGEKLSSMSRPVTRSSLKSRGKDSRWNAANQKSGKFKHIVKDAKKSSKLTVS